MLDMLKVQSGDDTDKYGKATLDPFQDGEKVVCPERDMSVKMSAHAFFRYTAYSYDHVLL